MSEAIILPMATSISTEVAGPSTDWIAQFVADLPTAVAVFDRELRYVAANQSWADAFNLAGAALGGQRHHELDPIAGRQLVELQRRALSGEAVQGCDLIVGDAAGSRHFGSIRCRPRRAGNGNILGVVATLNDIGIAAAPAIWGEDAADRLTGIAGREAFLARLRAALLTTGTPRREVAIFLLDIEDFKGINGLYGARVGDRVLAAIANRLLTAIGSRSTGAPRVDAPAMASNDDLVGRLGADEFAIMIASAPPSAAEADEFARRVLKLVAAPVVVGEQRIRLTANIGYLTTGPRHHTDDDVLRDLNVALHEAKLRGPNSAKASEPALTSMVGRRLAVLDELRRALDESEFVLHYQPILSLADHRIAGAEALLRWQHPRQGLVAPNDFLPLLEESGLIVPVGTWIIREVVRQMQIWQTLYGRDMLDWVSINVSARQFNDPTLLLATLGEISDSGFPLERLKLEITESAVMRNPEITRQVFGELQHIGVRVGLDDFGTGYSALGALRHYNVDMIKIDRDFTNRLDTTDGRELVLTLLKIGRIYGAAVVAEGVETNAQRELLRASGCDFGQGYLFAKPMDGRFFGAYALTQMIRDTGAA